MGEVGLDYGLACLCDMALQYRSRFLLRQVSIRDVCCMCEFNRSTNGVLCTLLDARFLRKVARVNVSTYQRGRSQDNAWRANAFEFIVGMYRKSFVKTTLSMCIVFCRTGSTDCHAV